MNSTTDKVINFMEYHKKKICSKYTQVKPIKKLSDKDALESQKYINDSWERE